MTKFEPGQEVFWVTLAASTGIRREIVHHDFGYAVMMRRPRGGSVYAGRKHLTTSANIALQRANDARLQKIASLEKQLQRLRDMQIEVPS